MKMIKNLILSAIAFVACFIASEFMLGEAAVHYQLWATGAASRAELAGDLGLGLLGMLVVFPVSFILSLVAAIFMWCKRREPIR